MSAPAKKGKKGSAASVGGATYVSSAAQSTAPADSDAAMTIADEGEAAAPFVPSTIIGSYLSQNYNAELENKKTPGFICGQCYCLNTLKARENIRCRDCGYRIMYKERLRRPMEYSAQ